MTNEAVEHYVANRFSELLSFYDRRSKTSKRMHRICSLVIIVVSSALPVCVVSGVLERHKLVGGLASATIVAITAWAAHAQYHENWLRYRRTWDSLMRENALFRAGAGEYGDSDKANCVFVQRVETLADIEGKDWEIRNASVSKGKNSSPAGEC